MELQFNTKYELGQIIKIKSVGEIIKVKVTEIIIFFNKNGINKRYHLDFINKKLKSKYGGFQYINEENIKEVL